MIEEESDQSLALITTVNKRQNTRVDLKQVECLEKSCTTLTPPHLRLCRLHYHECIAGKHPSMRLKTGDSATYDAKTNKIVFPHLANSATGNSKVRKGVRALVATTAVASSVAAPASN